MAKETVHELQAKGVAVKSIAADIGRESDVVSLLAEIRDTMPPLQGILHAAAVLDDALLVNLDEAKLQRVMGPKACGAWLLHKHTQTLPIDFLVLFSSISALVGNPGQGNYAAANAFLDALAQHRRALGLPATAVNWGALADVGMVAENRDVADHLARIGINTIAPADAVAALRWALERNLTQFGFMDVEWSKWCQFYPATAASPIFADLHTAGGSTSATDLVSAGLLSADPEKRPVLLAAMLAEFVAETMRMPASRIDINEPLSEMGIDSLMAVELQVCINTKLGIDFPVLELIRGGSIMGLANELLVRMKTIAGGGEDEEPAASTSPVRGGRTTRPVPELNAA
jgi:acyl carrier protein/short-subunit dehydrogenase